MLGISRQGGAGRTPVTEYLDVRWVGIMNTAEMKTNGPLAALCAPTPVPCLSLFSYSRYLDSQNNAKVKGTEVRMEERPSCKAGILLLTPWKLRVHVIIKPSGFA